MTNLTTHTRPEERPDWQQEEVGMLAIEYRYRRTPINPAGANLPVYRVKAGSRPHPWPESKQQVPADDFLMKRITEQT